MKRSFGLKHVGSDLWVLSIPCCNVVEPSAGTIIADIIVAIFNVGH